MGIRTRILRWLDVDGAVRAHTTTLQEQLAAAHDQIGEQTTRIDKLDKRLGMAMGAVQAATAQIMAVKTSADEAQSTALKASQTAKSALRAAEAASDGVAALEG